MPVDTGTWMPVHLFLKQTVVRWAVDLGRDLYTLPRLKGLGSDLFIESQESKRWSIFADGSESHSILRFNGAVQLVDGKAEIRPAKNPLVSPAYLVDLTPVYADQVVTATRGISLRPDRSVMIRDEWQTGDRGLAVAFQWMTFAKVEIKNDSIILAQGGEKLLLRVVSPATAHVAVQDMSAAQNVWDYPKPGLSRITIRVNSAAKSAGQLVILADPSWNATTENSELLTQLKDW